jgi:hypothetical protein
MPLIQGKSDKTRNANIEEILSSYKANGAIGPIRPRNMKHAQEIAARIAYDKQRNAQRKAKKAMGD